MAYRPHGRARVNATSPRAFAICDACGFLYNHSDLRWRMDYGGNRLVNKRFLVCERCLDIPQQQLRVKILPPDPMPIRDPRPLIYNNALNYPLEIQGGGYSLNGSSISGKLGRNITNSAGAIAFTGNSATLKWFPAALDATTGHFNISGSNLGAYKNAILTTIGSFNSGFDGSFDFTILVGYYFNENSGGYTANGSATLHWNRPVMPATTGTYLLNGTATLLRRASLPATTGGYSITGASETLLKSINITLSTGSFLFTGAIPIFHQNHTKLSASTGGYSIGGDITLVKTQHMATYVMGRDYNKYFEPPEGIGGL